MLDNTVPYWTLPTAMLEGLANEITEMIVAVNYISPAELSNDDCRRLTMMLKELRQSVENQLRYRNNIDGK